MHAERKVLLYCDLHGHSRKKNAFFYGCSYKNYEQEINGVYNSELRKCINNFIELSSDASSKKILLEAVDLLDQYSSKIENKNDKDLVPSYKISNATIETRKVENLRISG